MTRKYLSFDLETSRTVPDGEDIRSHQPLGICCYAVAWLEKEGGIATLTGCGADGDNNAAKMTREECAALVRLLYGAVTVGGWTLLGHNLMGFDLDILAEESGLHALCAELALHCVDTCFQIHCMKGYPVGIDAIARAMGIPGKIEGMSGALAPQRWAEGKYNEVLHYVAQDAKMTLQVALEVERRGSLSWIAKSGRLNHLTIPRWMTVFECLQLPEPDTSWMTQPIPRERFTSWMTPQRITETS